MSARFELRDSATNTGTIIKRRALGNSLPWWENSMQGENNACCRTSRGTWIEKWGINGRFSRYMRQATECRKFLYSGCGCMLKTRMVNPRNAKRASSAAMLDIAEEPHLSVATVSRALRRVPGINADTRAQALQTASKLGYRLRESYRPAALASDCPLHVGIFMGTVAAVCRIPASPA